MNPVTCDRCHQSDEFLISESGTYTCICGYQFVIEPTRSESHTEESSEAHLITASVTTPLKHTLH
ncbi:hypothetical protein C9I91_05250 [Photobacterium jeanii]|nr:hypothetical protein C9I91_05250 [Photobacterium jeanii]